MEEVKIKQNQKEKEKEEKEEKQENIEMEEDEKKEEKEEKEEKKEKKEKSSFGKKFLIGLGAVLGTTAAVIGTKMAYDHFTKKKKIYSIGDSAIEFKNSENNDSIIKKLESQNKLKAKVIDNTNDKNYIRANSITELNINETATEYICPITQKIMEEPVITPYGTTYEKKAIIDWIKKNKTDFKTNNLLTEDMLVTNHILNVAIKDYKESIIRNQN